MLRHGPITVQNVVTYDVVLAVPNPDRALFPGMTADTHIVIDEHADVLRVPLPAVRFNPEGLNGLRGGSSRGAEDRPEARGEGTAAGGGPEERSANANESRPEGRGQGRTEARAEGRGERGGRPRGEGRPERQGGGRAFGRRGEHRSQVWVLLENGELKAVPVTTGIDDGALIEVSGPGLKPGDKVVVNAVAAKESGSGAERRAASAPSPGQAFRPPGPRL
jgi:HlyD family secretion protein